MKDKRVYQKRKWKEPNSTNLKQNKIFLKYDIWLHIKNRRKQTNEKFRKNLIKVRNIYKLANWEKVKKTKGTTC